MGSVRSGLSLGPFKTKNGSVPDAVVMVIKANERFLFLLEAKFNADVPNPSLSTVRSPRFRNPRPSLSVARA